MELHFRERPVFEIGSTQIVAPVILQYESLPLIEMTQLLKGGFTLEYSVFHSDGTYLAKIKGTGVYPTQAGRKAGVKLRNLDRHTICSVGKQTIFEVRKTVANALKGEGEIYTNDGVLMKITDADLVGKLLEVGQDDDGSNWLKMGRLQLKGGIIRAPIGLMIYKSGRCAVAASRYVPEKQEPSDTDESKQSTA